MRLAVRTQCQYRLQRQLFTELSDLLMRRRLCTTPMGRLSQLQTTVAYPWRLNDMCIDLARENMQVLIGVGDNLVDVLVAARQYTLAHAPDSGQVPLRAPVWLHVRVLLAAMQVLQANVKGQGRIHPQGISECRIEIAFALQQLAKGCDQHFPIHAELFDNVGAFYFELGSKA